MKVSYDTFPTIAVISATICAIIFIWNLSFCTSVKIFRAPAATLTNDFCSVVNFTSTFLWLEDIIFQSSVLTNGIDRGLFLESKEFFSISFEVVWEIRETKLLQIMSLIFSCEGGVNSHWLSIFWTLSKFRLCTLCDSLSNYES